MKPGDEDQGILLFVTSHGNLSTNIAWVSRALLTQLVVFGQKAALTLYQREQVMTAGFIFLVGIWKSACVLGLTFMQRTFSSY